VQDGVVDAGGEQRRRVSIIFVAERRAVEPLGALSDQGIVCPNAMATCASPSICTTMKTTSTGW
jgi:hypothetical protein